MEENHFHRPYGWKKYTISEVCDILDNMRRPLNKMQREVMKGEIPYYGANNIQDYINDFIFDEPLILIAEDGGNFEEYETRPIAQNIDGKSWVNNHTHVLRVKPNYSHDLVFYNLVNKNILEFIKGGTRAKLNKRELELISLVLPKSKPEQTTIARILAKVDEAITKTQQLIAKYTRIKTGLMQDLLIKGIDENGNIRSEEDHEFKDSPLGRIPKEWDVPKLDDIKEFITSGSRGWAQYYSVEGSQFIRITNLKRRQIEIETSEMKFVNLPGYAEGMRSKLQTGDLLISITADLGIIGVVPPAFGDAFVNQHIALVRLIQTEINPKFIGYFLCSQRGQLMFSLLNDGGAKAGLNLKTIGKIPVLKPDETEQNSIVDRIESVNNVLLKFQIQLSKLQSLKTGLMQDLISGKVRVNHLMKKTVSV